ncbi:MAG: ParB/Srx family N-terminal domain-containing protein [Emcibacteraceae bacterium]|nr:ParB/Srx family N-terminal domain-containing protein [Emcibacteraceae bacterium]
MSTFKSKCLSINPLKPYKNNDRTHSRKQIKQLAESIKEFGFANQILIDEHNMVHAGHGRLLAAKEMGMSEVQKRAHKTGRREYLSELDPLLYVIRESWVFKSL